MAVDAGPQEADGRDAIAPGEAGELGADLLLSEGCGQREPMRAVGGGDIGEEVVDRADPDHGEHPLAVGSGVRRVGHQPAVSSA
jgi:hypothetical protein